MQAPGSHPRAPTVGLEPGQSIVAVAPGEPSVALVLRDVEPDMLDALAEHGRVRAGDVMTVRVSHEGRVSFLQLVAKDIDRSEVGRDVVHLAVRDSVSVESERWMERVAYDGPVEIQVEDDVVSGRLCDLSPLGVRFVGPRAVAVDEPVGLLVRIADGGSVSLQVRARRCAVRPDGGYEVAAEVTALSPAGWARLERLLRAARERPA